MHAWCARKLPRSVVMPDAGFVVGSRCVVTSAAYGAPTYHGYTFTKSVGIASRKKRQSPQRDSAKRVAAMSSVARWAQAPHRQEGVAAARAHRIQKLAMYAPRRVEKATRNAWALYEAIILQEFHMTCFFRCVISQ